MNDCELGIEKKIDEVKTNGSECMKKKTEKIRNSVAFIHSSTNLIFPGLTILWITRALHRLKVKKNALILISCVKISNWMLTISNDIFDNANMLGRLMILFGKICTHSRTCTRCLFYSSRIWCPPLRLYKMSHIIQNVQSSFVFSGRNETMKNTWKVQIIYWSMHNFILNTITHLWFNKNYTVQQWQVES